MRLVEQWRQIERGLPDGWSDARLSLALADAADAERTAALLGPSAPGVSGDVVRFSCARGGGGVGPEAIVRMLRRIDAEGIAGTLDLVAAGRTAAPPPRDRPTLAASWDAAAAALPDDWSDALAELELRSTDYLERAALLLSPLNPARVAGRPAFRFRAARTFGYGASQGMVRRCLERLDEAGIDGTVRIVGALSDTDPVHTQGPVWYVGGTVA